MSREEKKEVARNILETKKKDELLIIYIEI